MAMYYAKRALEILREEGPVELYKRSWNHFVVPSKLFFKHYKEYLRYKRKWGRSYPKFTRLIYIDPDNVKYRLDPGLNRTHDIGRGPHILTGDWHSAPESDEIWYSRHRTKSANRQRLKLQNHLIYISMRQRYQDNCEWDETKIFEYIANNDGIEDKYRSYDAPESMKKRLEKCDEIYRHMSKNGYYTQRELQKFPYPEYSEILIHVGPNGNLFLGQGGRHRLGMAKTLDLETIPARVSVRHKQWQELRDEIHNNGLPEGREDLINHPDLQNIIKV